MREPHEDLGYTAGRDRGDVLPAGALGFRRLARNPGRWHATACIATTRTFGQFLKHRNPQSEVKVKDLQSGEMILVAYKADAG